MKMVHYLKLDSLDGKRRTKRSLERLKLNMQKTEFQVHVVYVSRWLQSQLY